MATTIKRGSHVAADRPLAVRVGARLRRARLEAGLTQAQLAEGRYTKAYVSALENGLSKPSMAALNYFADKLRLPLERFLGNGEPAWTRLEADLLLASGRWIEAGDAYQALLDEAPSERTQAELLLGLAETSARLERGQAAIRAAARAEDLLRAQGRTAEAAWASYWQAYGLYELEQSGPAHAQLERILDAVAGGLEVDPDLPVRALVALASIAGRDEEPTQALGYLEQARGRIADLDVRKRGTFLFSLAVSYHELGDHEAAITTGTQALAHYRAADADREAANLENELALVYAEVGSLKAARSHVALARAYFEQQGDRRWLAHVLDTEAQIALAARTPEEGVRLASEALALADETSNQKAGVSARMSLGRALRAVGDLGGASAALEAAANMARDAGRRAQLQAALTEWSEVVAQTGDHPRAFELARQALESSKR